MFLGSSGLKVSLVICDAIGQENNAPSLECKSPEGKHHGQLLALLLIDSFLRLGQSLCLTYTLHIEALRFHMSMS